MSEFVKRGAAVVCDEIFSQIPASGAALHEAVFRRAARFVLAEMRKCTPAYPKGMTLKDFIDDWAVIHGIADFAAEAGIDMEEKG